MYRPHTRRAVFDGRDDRRLPVFWPTIRAGPERQRSRPSDIVILDNLSCHKSPAVRLSDRSRRRATLSTLPDNTVLTSSTRLR